MSVEEEGADRLLRLWTSTALALLKHRALHEAPSKMLTHRVLATLVDIIELELMDTNQLRQLVVRV